MSRQDIPRGKGMLIYLFSKFDRSISDVVAEAARVGMKWLAPRVVGHDQFDARNVDQMGEFVDACNRHGVRPGGWGYHIGLDWLLRPIWKAEAEKASEAINTFKLDFYMINAEHEYKIGVRPWKHWRVRTEALRGAMANWWLHFRSLQPTISTGMSSYRYPNTHREFVWDESMPVEHCDFSMPQVYALGDFREHGPAIQLAECFRQYDELRGEMLPMIPLMALYPWNNWRQTPAQTRLFADKCRELQLPAYGGWALDYMRPTDFSAIAESWSPPVPSEPDDPAPEPVAFNRLPDRERWSIVELAMKEHGFVDQDGTVPPELLE